MDPAAREALVPSVPNAGNDADVPVVLPSPSRHDIDAAVAKRNVLHGRGVPAPHELSLSGTVALFQSFRRGGAAVAVGGAVTDVGAPPAELAKFGPFVLQGALETLASEEELRGVLQQVDWAACMHGPSRNHLFWKLCAAAKRVASPATVKATAALVFRIFGVQSPECAPRVWPVLLACDPSADDKVCLCSPPACEQEMKP